MQTNENNTFKKIILSVIFFATIISSLFLAISNFAHFLNPAQWWMIALTGLIFPLLLLFTIAFAIFWIFVNRKKTILPLIAILLSFPNIKTSFAFHPSSKFVETKAVNNIRIVTWNVGLMNYEAPDSATAADNNALIFNSLQELNADVICLQEFFTEVIPNSNLNFIDSITRNLNYPYHYFSYDRSQFNGAFYSGTIIFSKYKIIDTNKVVYPKPFPGSVIEAGLLVNNDTINIITTRLQSFHLETADYQALHSLKEGSTNGIADTKTIVGKLKYGYAQKVAQVNIIKQLITDSRHPVIFTADMNDVPSSYAYANIKNDMTDAWLDKGFGIGRSFRYIAPTLRIDYIFLDNNFNCTQTRRILTTSSDHNGLVADFSMNKTN